MTPNQAKTVAKFEARAALLGHEFHAYDVLGAVTMVAQNPYGERMTWDVLPDGAALVTS